MLASRDVLATDWGNGLAQSGPRGRRWAVCHLLPVGRVGPSVPHSCMKSVILSYDGPGVQTCTQPSCYARDVWDHSHCRCPDRGACGESRGCDWRSITDPSQGQGKTQPQVSDGVSGRPCSPSPSESTPQLEGLHSDTGLHPPSPAQPGRSREAQGTWQAHGSPLAQGAGLGASGGALGGTGRCPLGPLQSRGGSA